MHSEFNLSALISINETEVPLSFRAEKIIILSFLASIVGFSLFVSQFTNTRDFFPYFEWKLFADFGREQIVYDLRVQSSLDSKFCALRDCLEPEFRPRVNLLVHTIQRLGQACQKKDFVSRSKLAMNALFFLKEYRIPHTRVVLFQGKIDNDSYPKTRTIEPIKDICSFRLSKDGGQVEFEEVVL